MIVDCIDQTKQIGLQSGRQPTSSIVNVPLHIQPPEQKVSANLNNAISDDRGRKIAYSRKKIWSHEEKLQLFKLHNEIGNKWIDISKGLSAISEPRQPLQIKNYFYNLIRRLQRKMISWIKSKRRQKGNWNIKFIKSIAIKRIFFINGLNQDQLSLFKIKQKDVKEQVYKLILKLVGFLEEQNPKDEVLDQLVEEMRAMGRSYPIKLTQIVRCLSEENTGFSKKNSVVDIMEEVEDDEQKNVKRKMVLPYSPPEQNINQPIDNFNLFPQESVENISLLGSRLFRRNEEEDMFAHLTVSDVFNSQKIGQKQLKQSTNINYLIDSSSLHNSRFIEQNCLIRRRE